MKLLPFLLVLNLTGILSTTAFSKGIPDCKKPGKVIACIRHFHLAPKAVDDKLSQEIMDRLVYRLDPLGLVYLQSEMDAIVKYRTELDEQWLQSRCEFIDLLESSYGKALQRLLGNFEKILSKPLNLNVKESLVFPDETKSYLPQNEQELLNRQTKYLKMQLLDLIFEGNPETGEIPSVEAALKKEAECRSILLKREKRKLGKRSEGEGGLRGYVMNLYLDVIATHFDPHTTYFTETENEEFKEDLSSEEQSFGIYWEETENGEIAVAELTPGGAAWNTGQINRGDILVEIKWPDGKTEKLSETDPEICINKLYSGAIKSAEFVFRKSDGQTFHVEIFKQKTQSEENVVNGFVLKGKRKIGYIALPGFYTNWEGTNTNGCAADVAKEIMKLKQEQIEGLILDLRYNGGGSLGEALQLLGIFIDEGPLGIAQYSKGKPMLFKDPNRGTAYDGPLMVMINGYSASASEFVAAALQDYKRGIIVGTKSYGKATGQNIFPVDTTYLNKDAFREKDDVPVDFVKVTMMKLYRINSKTHQAKGVFPDVLIPDLSQFSSTGEGANPRALPSDSTLKKAVWTAWKDIAISALQAKANARQQKDSLVLWYTTHQSELIAYFNNNTPIPLDAVSFRAELMKDDLLWEDFDRLMDKKTKNMSIEMHAYDKDLNNVDAFRDKIMKSVVEDLYYDHELDEAFKIMADYIDNL